MEHKHFEELYKSAQAVWDGLEHADKPVIRIGMATCGRAAGSMSTMQTLEAELKRRGIDAQIVPVGCIGLCYLEPIVDIMKPGHPRVVFQKVDAERMVQLIESYLVKDEIPSDSVLCTIGERRIEGIPEFRELPMLKGQVRIASRNLGHINPEDINQYIAHDGYRALNNALRMKPEEIIAELKKSNLRGRGGAGFPTWRKWDEGRANPVTPKYIVCNADEGDPGAFMNRSVLEGDPHSVLEGMVIGAYAIGLHEGYIYCRAEKPLAIERLQGALKQMKEYGLQGNNILGSGFNFTVELRKGAGSFVCGESSALMYSIEGKRGMPRVKPPRSVASGLWGQPTVLNNVETFALVPNILLKGGAWFNQYGTELSKGTKTFALTGKINRPGLIEVPMGITLRQIVNDIGGGILENRPLKAIQTGGPSGGCIPESLLDTQVDFEGLVKVGSIMGSGGMVVMDSNTCMVDTARYFLSFCREESCGKCVPCREGLPLMVNMVEKICQGEGKPGDIEQLLELGETITQTSLCGLGQSAANTVLTSVRYFRDEWEVHIKEGTCPAHVCKPLDSYYIETEKCKGCGICLKACPVEAIYGEKAKPHLINQEICIKCGTCYAKCPPRFRAITKTSGRRPAAKEAVLTANQPGVK